MVSLKSILFIASTVTAAVVTRDASTIMSDLKTINSDTTSLTEAVKGYNGGLFAAIPIENAESKLEDAVKGATSDAKSSGPISDSDSQSIIDYINNTLEPNIRGAAAALESKKQQIDSAGLTSTVKKDLQNLKSETDDLGAALIKVAPADKSSAAKAALGKIDTDLNEGIAFFS